MIHDLPMEGLFSVPDPDGGNMDNWEWCLENFGAVGDVWSYGRVEHEFLFVYEADAILFKLRWVG